MPFNFGFNDLPLGIQILFSFALVNLFLGLFNLLPIPPLDGSALIERVLPGEVAAELVPVPALRDPRPVPPRLLDRRSRSDPRSVRGSSWSTSSSGEAAPPLGALRPRALARAAAARRRRVGRSRCSHPGRTRSGQQQPNHDRRHSIGSPATCRRSSRAPSTPTTPRWIAAALLHDIGKLDASLGVYGRVVATVSGAAAGRDMADAWSERSGFTRRVGLYLRHPELGADRIRLAGGPEAAALGRRPPRPRHLGPPRHPGAVVAALAAADND